MENLLVFNKTTLNGVTNVKIANNPAALQLLNHLANFSGYPIECIKRYFNNSPEALSSLLELIQSQPKQNYAFLIMQTDDEVLYWENEDDTFAQLIQTDCKIKSQNGYKFHILIAFD